jgi:hypothetical protein
VFTYCRMRKNFTLNETGNRLCRTDPPAIGRSIRRRITMCRRRVAHVIAVIESRACRWGAENRGPASAGNNQGTTKNKVNQKNGKNNKLKGHKIPGLFGAGDLGCVTRGFAVRRPIAARVPRWSTIVDRNRPSPGPGRRRRFGRGGQPMIRLCLMLCCGGGGVMSLR